MLSVAFVALFVLGGASADTLWLGDVGLRYSATEGERCITRDNLQETAMPMLGLDADAARGLMLAEGSYLMLYAPDYQITLCVSDAPSDISARDISELQAAERDSLLAYLKRSLAATAAQWVEDMPDYALTQSGAGGNLPFYSLTMSTLYLGRLYSFRLDVVGRELTDTDSAALRSVVARTLRLGAIDGEAEGAGALALESLPAPSVENAAMTVNNDNVRLTAAPVPSIIGTNQLTLSGETDPRARMRVKVNGEASVWFSPDENGAYSFLARGFLNGKDNAVEISASVDDVATILSFSVKLDWQLTPLAVSPTSSYSYDDVFTIEGSTLPGADIQVVKGGSTSSATVDENGLFSFPLNTRKPSGYGFTVRASYPGYKRAEITGRIRRVMTEDAVKAAQRIAYDELVDNPGRYADTAVCYTGAIEALSYEAGTPKCLLKTGDGATFSLLCRDLIGLDVGNTISFIGVLRGTNGTFGDDGNAYPEISMQTLLIEPDRQDGE